MLVDPRWRGSPLPPGALAPAETTVCTSEVDDQARCGHNLVSGCLLRREELQFELTQEGARALELGGDLRIVVTLEPRPIKALWELRKALAVIFLGMRIYREDL
jgi:hypothetical protein